MNKITTNLLALSMMLCGGNMMDAAPFHDAASANNTRATMPLGQKAGENAKILRSYQLSAAKLSQSSQTEATAARRASGLRTSQANDLQAVNIQMGYDSGDAFARSSAVTYSLKDDTLSIINFNGMGETVKAKVDFDGGTVSVKCQKMYTSTSYGRCNIVPYNTATLTVDTLGTVSGTVSGGNITLDGWCCLIMEGEYKGYSLGTIYYRTELKPSNTMMKNVSLDSDSVPQNEDFPMYVEQETANMVKIYNFSGISSCVDVQLRGDKSLYITPTLLFKNTDYGNFYCYPADWTTGLYYPLKKIAGTADTNKMSWGNWIIQSSNGKYFYSRILSTEITLPFDLTFPAARTQDGFKGTGTEEDPYLIENAADLFALSDSVNMAAIPSGAKYVDAFKGKFFKQTAAINMKDYKFPPIGGFDETYRFAGTYDGGGKTISNLTVETGGQGYCALFGAVDTCGVLKNIKLTSPTSRSQYYYTGTLGAWCQGTVDNCSVTNATVEGLYCVGGVLGIGGPTTNVSFTGNVTGFAQTGGVIGVTRSPVAFLSATNTTVTSTGTTVSTSVGGVVGYLSNNRNGSLSDSYFSGDVLMTKSGQYGGTIAGITVETPISRCFSVGEIHATGNTAQSAAGGIVGAVQGSDVSDCYFAGNMNISGSSMGSIMGYVINVALAGHPDHSSITNCYVTGTSRSTTTAAYAPYVGRFDTTTGGLAPIITNCRYDNQRLPLFVGKDGSSATDEMTTATAWEGYSTDVWAFADKLYPKLKAIAANAPAYVGAAPLYFNTEEQSVENINDNFTAATANSVTWKVLRNGAAGTSGNGVTVATGGTFELTGSFSTDTIVATSGVASKWIVIKCSPKSMFDGDGTETSPYLLKTKADLIRLSDGTSNKNLTFDGSYFKMTNDIDLEYDETFKGIASNSSATYAFGGIFDGGGYTIHRCKLVFSDLDAAGKPSNHEAQRGFISRLKAVGTVKNLRMAADCDFTFYSNSGGIVGYSYGQVLNCRNYATIKAYSGTIGGIVGYSQKGSAIKDCYNGGKVVAGYFYAGGIAGICYGAIENCQNDGEVCEEVLSNAYSATSLNAAGGICHSLLGDGTIKNVLNTGYVHSYKYVGGILAVYNGTAGSLMAESTLNTGMLGITATDGTVGNIVGKIYKVGVCKYNYYDNKVSTYTDCNSTAYENSCPTATEELTSGSTIEGLDPAYWTFKKGEYPTLTMFADEPLAQAAAKAVVTFNGSTRSDSIKHDSSLASSEGLIWTLKKSTGAFSIDGSTLAMDAGKLLSDTLVASCGGYVKMIPIVAVPDTASVPTIDVTYADGKFVIAIASTTTDAKLYYTLDSSIPTTTSALYDNVITKTANADFTVKAIAVKHNYYDSAVADKIVSVSGVTDNFTDKTVKSRVYVSTSGIKSATPVEGVNVVVTTYDDGTVTIAKKVVKASGIVM